ncbi:Modulator of drug activity (mda66) [Escherichia coli P12b]|uniref:Uncharacterized protein n=1 Tax=Escherichia coli TaxID=562 RepID=Q46756_ECOLX|nr:orf1 [Escherichia coli]AFG41959.1 Modulator of drug activity (mda66) [Escherichia coli P12b]
MLAIFFSIAGNIRHFYHVISDKCRQRFHTEELVCFMERQIHTVNANAVEELIFFGEGFHWCVPGQRKHIFFALYQAAGTVFFRRIFAGTTIAGIQRPVTFGEYIINVFFHCPRRAHPPAWHLPDHHISPEKVLYFRFDIVVAVGANDADIMPKVAQCAIRDFGQGVVQLTIGVGEFFRAVDNQDVAHFLTSR